MSAFGGLAVQIALMILLGILLKKTGIITQDLQKGLSKLMLTAIMPISILQSSLEDTAHPSATNLLLSVVLVTGYYVLSILICRGAGKALFQEERLQKLFVNLSVFANVGFIGLPVIQALYGSEAAIYVVIYNLEYQVFLAFYAVRMISGKKEFHLMEIFREPMNAASFIAVILFFIPVHVPAPLMDTLSQAGGMMVPLSMIIIGCQLSEVNVKELIRNHLVWPVSCLRLLLFPLIMLVVCRVLKIDLLLAEVMIVMTGLPSGSLNSILAEQYDCYPHDAAVTVVGSTVLMAVSLPVMMMLINVLL